MNLKTQFTKPECDKFRAECNFTPDELEVFNLRTQAKTITEICFLLHMSQATVNRKIKNIKSKITRI